MSAALPTKIGQAPTDSPRTYETKKNRFGSLFSSLSISNPESPLSGRNKSSQDSGGSDQDHATFGHEHNSAIDTPIRSREQGSRWLSWISPSRSAVIDPEENGQNGDGSTGSKAGPSRGSFSRSRDTRQKPTDYRPSGQSHMLQLPDELIIEILVHLPPSLEQLRTLSLVSKRFNALSQSPSLWSILYSTSFPHDKTLQQPVEAVDLPPGRWVGSRYTPAPPPLETFLHTKHSGGRIPVHFPTLYLSRRQLGDLIRGRDFTCAPGIETTEAHSSAIYCIELCHPWLFTGSRDRSIKVWRLGITSKRYGAMRPTQLVCEVQDAHAGSVLSLKFEMNETGDEGTMVSCSSDHTTVVWSVRLGTEVTIEMVGTLGEQNVAPLNVALAQNHIITCSPDCTVRMYDRTTRMLVHSLQGHTGPVNCLALDPGNEGNRQRICSASADGSWVIWDMITGEQVQRGTTQPKQGLACNRWIGDRLYAGGNGRTVVVFDAATSDAIHTLEGHHDLVRAIFVDPACNIVVSGGYDCEVRVWDITTGALAWTTRGTQLDVVFAVAAAGGQVVIAHGDKIRVMTFGADLPYRDLLVRGSG